MFAQDPMSSKVAKKYKNLLEKTINVAHTNFKLDILVWV